MIPLPRTPTIEARQTDVQSVLVILVRREISEMKHEERNSRAAYNRVKTLRTILSVHSLEWSRRFKVWQTVLATFSSFQPKSMCAKPTDRKLHGDRKPW